MAPVVKTLDLLIINIIGFWRYRYISPLFLYTVVYSYQVLFCVEFLVQSVMAPVVKTPKSLIIDLVEFWEDHSISPVLTHTIVFLSLRSMLCPIFNLIGCDSHGFSDSLTKILSFTRRTGHLLLGMLYNIYRLNH